MVLVHDIVNATGRLRDAQMAEIEARTTLATMVRDSIREDLPGQAVRAIEERAAELLPDGALGGRISLHVLLSALEDLWRAGRLYESRSRDGVL